ncbi:MAG: peptidylprolyl isomerase [Ignavibacteriaceae bacterium]
MLLRITFFLSFSLMLLFVSCAPEHSQIVLADFGNQKVTMKDFEDAYANNAGGYDIAKKDSLSKLKNFLDLYVDFRMKLRDAFVRGFQQDSSINKELADYKQKVGVSYILEKQIVDPGIKELYERRKWEYRVSHIMFRPDSTGWEHARIMANEVLDSIKNGANFEEMAKKYSQDMYSRSKGGDIFYITAGELPYQFEDAVYNTIPGQVYPQVVKSPYGYHIIKVTDKRIRVPEIRASHILASFADSTGKIDSARALAKIDTVMYQLEHGGNFEQLAEKYSDDPGTRKRGGDLGYFGMRMMILPFSEAAFDLKNIGDISGIVETRYGYHIIKLTGRKPYPTFEEDKDNLKKIFQKTRYQDEYDSLVSQLKKEYNYQPNEKASEYLISHTDTAKVGETLPKMDVGMHLFSYAGKFETIGDFWNRMSEKPEYLNKPVNSTLLSEAVNKISGDIMLEEDAMNLDKTDKDFAALMKNYRDGIYIFKLQQDEVWNKVTIDSTKLYDFYLSTKDNYRTQDKINFAEIFSTTDSLIHNYYNMLKQGANFDSLAALYTERPGYKETKGVWGFQDVNSSQLSSVANSLKNPGDFSNVFESNDGYSIVSLIAKEPSHIKTFEEAKAEAAGAYQDAESKKLENNYINSLKELYKPKIFYNELDKAFKQN